MPTTFLHASCNPVPRVEYVYGSRVGAGSREEIAAVVLISCFCPSSNTRVCVGVPVTYPFLLSSFTFIITRVHFLPEKKELSENLVGHVSLIILCYVSSIFFQVSFLQPG